MKYVLISAVTQTSLRLCSQKSGGPSASSVFREQQLRLLTCGGNIISNEYVDIKKWMTGLLWFVLGSNLVISPDRERMCEEEYPVTSYSVKVAWAMFHSLKINKWINKNAETKEEKF